MVRIQSLFLGLVIPLLFIIFIATTACSTLSPLPSSDGRYPVCLDDDMSVPASTTDTISDRCYWAMVNREPSISIPGYALSSFNPSQPFADHRFGSGVGDYLEGIVSYSFSGSTINYQYNPRMDFFEQQLDSAVSSLRLGGLSDIDKATAIASFIASWVAYSDLGFDEDTAIGALLDRKASCVGYSTLFSRMCKKVGVDCVCVTGKTHLGDHMWNMVCIDGTWTSVDVCWADTGSDINSDYLFRGDVGMDDGRVCLKGWATQESSF